MYNENAQLNSARTKKLLKLIGIVVLSILVMSFQPFTYENIDAGNVGIKINLYGTDRGVDDVTLVTGRVWYNSWTTKVIEYPTYEQTVDYEPFTVTARDNAVFQIDPKLNFAIEQTLVPSIYKKYRKPLDQLQQTFIRNQVFDAYRIIANRFASDSLMSNREIFEKNVERTLSDSLSKDGFIKPKLTSGITPPESMSRMIEQKNASIQARLKAENEAKQAEAEAKVKIARANGEAQALLVRAKAEADANKLRQQTITPMLLQQQWIQKWKGDMPTTIAGGSSNFMIGLR